MFEGVYTALVTPFGENGKIDFEVFEKLVKAQMDSGVDGLVLLGTTAETACLSPKEKINIILAAKALMPADKKIIIGVGGNSTHETVKNAKQFLEFQPDAFLVVTPYYNKPNATGLIGHFKRVAELNVPIILYHIPGRTGLKVPVSTMAKLIEEVPLIKGIKESDYDIARLTEQAVKIGGKVTVICGNDDMLFTINKGLGGCGVISAGANALAPAMVKMYKGVNCGEGFETYKQAYEAFNACYYETNPTCVKYMLSKLGFGREDVRLPLGPISDETKKRIDAVMENTPKELFVK